MRRRGTSDSATFVTPDAAAIYSLCWKTLGLSQRGFSDRFGIPYATLQNIEQGRGSPKQLARLVLAAIALDPELMERAAGAASLSGSADAGASGRADLNRAANGVSDGEAGVRSGRRLPN